MKVGTKPAFITGLSENLVFFMNELVEYINNGGVVVTKTDTLYGILTSSFLPDSVKRIYEIKKRDKDKPFINLISDINQLSLFGVILTKPIQKLISTHWPGPVSLIFDIDSLKYREKFNYLHRGSNALAFRFPDDVFLQQMIDETGPLVAPSANLQGQEPALTMQDAQAYLGDSIDMYFDRGICLENKASKIIKINKDGSPEVLRS